MDGRAGLSAGDGEAACWGTPPASSSVCRVRGGFSSTTAPYAVWRWVFLGETKDESDGSQRMASLRSMMSTRHMSSMLVTIMPKTKGPRKPKRSLRAPATGGPTRNLLHHG